VAETAKYLGRCCARCPPQLITNKKMVKGYVSALLDCLSHADANVREAASEALGVLMKILGEPVMTKMMPDLEAIKLTKIKEYCEKTVLTGKCPKLPQRVGQNLVPTSLQLKVAVQHLKKCLGHLQKNLQFQPKNRLPRLRMMMILAWMRNQQHPHLKGKPALHHLEEGLQQVEAVVVQPRGHLQPQRAQLRKERKVTILTQILLTITTQGKPNVSKMSQNLRF